MDSGMFVCSQCDKSYSRKSHLIRHELTHTNQLSGSCPICKKEFKKPEVARRHSKSCAKKHNQPIPPAARAGRKKLSCDACFIARTACDRMTPCCSRCHALGRQCSLGENGPPRQTVNDCSTVAIMKPSNTNSIGADGGSYEFLSKEPFYFLLRFTDPSVKRDRLAIAETAGCSIRRNLATIYSSLEDSLSPIDSSLQFFINDLVDPELLALDASTLQDDYSYLSEFPSDDTASAALVLPNQLHKIATELVETSRSMIFAPDNTGDERQKNVLEIAELDGLFTVSNLSVFISAFFQSLHWHMPVVHCPTFDPSKVSNCLLLAIFLAGAAYTAPFKGTDLPPTLLTVAEEYIFRRIANLSSTTQDRYPLRGSTMETLQAALIVEMLQFSQGDPLTRRRIRVIRHPCLVSTIRSLGLFRLKRRHAPVCCEEGGWRELVDEEICIRVASWAFLADGFLTVCFKNHPSLSIFEMDCDFPWSTELFEAENVSSFNDIVTSHATEQPLPSLRKVVSDLLQIPSNTNHERVPSHGSLSIEHLLILIYAINSLAFQARSGLLGHISMDTIKLAAMNWKKLCGSVLGDLQAKKTKPATATTAMKIDQDLHLGYPKHAEELWWLLMTTLDVSSHGLGRHFPYLDSSETDDLGKLNEFIQFVSPKMSVLDGGIVGYWN